MSSAIVSYTGPRPYIDGRSPLVRLLDDASERLGFAQMTLEEARAESEQLSMKDAYRDKYAWRRKQLSRKGHKCPKCLGKGWMLSHRYAHIDDFVECPLCTDPRTYTGPYPTAGDGQFDIPF